MGCWCLLLGWLAAMGWQMPILIASSGLAKAPASTGPGAEQRLRGGITAVASRAPPPRTPCVLLHVCGRIPVAHCTSFWSTLFFVNCKSSMEGGGLGGNPPFVLIAATPSSGTALLVGAGRMGL